MSKPYWSGPGRGAASRFADDTLPPDPAGPMTATAAMATTGATADPIRRPTHRHSRRVRRPRGLRRLRRLPIRHPLALGGGTGRDRSAGCPGGNRGRDARWRRVDDFDHTHRCAGPGRNHCHDPRTVIATVPPTASTATHRGAAPRNDRDGHTHSVGRGPTTGRGRARPHRGDAAGPDGHLHRHREPLSCSTW